MNLIDWRKLYESNRAVIEGRRPLDADGPWRPGVTEPGGPHRPARAEIAAPPPGRWERLEHRSGGRARAVFVHTPAGLDTSVAAPLVVMLHGCTQSPASFSAATAMNAAADRHGFVVAYPEQTREENAQGCWNWFAPEHQRRDGGEPSSIAGAVRTIVDRWTIDPGRVFVAGLSAGGAMASIMAATHPDLFAAVAVHSGLAFASARTLPAAVAAMRNGSGDPEALGRAAHAAMGRVPRPVPALVIHGRADEVVCPVNGEEVARQWLATNRLAAGGAFAGDLGHPDEGMAERVGGRDVRFHRWLGDDGRRLVELVEVDGLAHAWSGGTAGGSYADPRGPSATDLVWEFFAQATPASPAGADAREGTLRR